jgi:hypothetical protein
MIRPRYINELKGISRTQKVDFRVQSPEGINKLPSSYVVVELVKAENKIPPVTALFEYSYGGIRLVALDNEELVQKNADDIIAFFEAPLQRETGYSVRVYEAKNQL